MYNITLFPNLFETFFKKIFNTLADSVLQGCIFSRETIKIFYKIKKMKAKVMK